MIGGSIINASVLGLESSTDHYLYVDPVTTTEFQAPVFLRARDNVGERACVGAEPRTAVVGKSMRQISITGRRTC